jgi:hypothetical protein
VSIRDHLRQRRTKWIVLSVVGFILFAGGGLLCSRTNNVWLLPIPLLGFILFGAGQFGRLFMTCPKCNSVIGFAPGYFANPLGANLRFCPSCGISFDTEYDETQKI